MVVWEQRWHPFRAEWVLFTSHRAGRPWIGETVAATADAGADYDPACSLCPGNMRLSGTRNDDYPGAWWFTNDLPCFGPGAPSSRHGDDLYRARPAAGTAEVVCHHPGHSRTLGDLGHAEVTAVFELLRERTVELAARDDVDSVLVFENRGAAVGTSNPHPHAQIYAGAMVYGHFAREWEVGEEHRRTHGRPILADVVERESAGPRVVAANGSFVACVPWFARYAYEVHVLPRRPRAGLWSLEPGEVAELAAVVRAVVRGFDALWGIPMPYVMAVHQAPTDGRPTEGYPFHLEFHPPLRTPDTLKYLAGPEIGGGSMTNESDPDAKAAELAAAVVRAGCGT